MILHQKARVYGWCTFDERVYGSIYQQFNKMSQNVANLTEVLHLTDNRTLAYMTIRNNHTPSYTQLYTHYTP
jgi:hypothetical protein